MYDEGSLVTLSQNKSHGEGEDAITLRSGICGMVARCKKEKPDGNHEYVVDFGAYGQWYCTNNELSGDDSADWDIEVETDRSDLNRDTPEGWIASTDPRDEILQVLTDIVTDACETESAPSINVEEDIKRRMKEISEGKY
jgi:hypothetical protein